MGMKIIGKTIKCLFVRQFNGIRNDYEVSTISLDSLKVTNLILFSPIARQFEILLRYLSMHLHYPLDCLFWLWIPYIHKI